MSSPLVWRNRCDRSDGESHYPEATTNSGMPFIRLACPSRSPPRSFARGSRSIRRLGDPGGRSRASKNMVVVGYSMGGIIARILATDMGDQFWATVSEKAFRSDPVGAGRSREAPQIDFLDASSRSKGSRLPGDSASRDAHGRCFVCSPWTQARGVARESPAFQSRVLWRWLTRSTE